MVGVAAVLLIGAWLMALRAHLRRQRARDAEWRGVDRRPGLWTSGARCLSCGGGGVLEMHDDELWFVCMQCGRRQPRRSRG